jgi:cytoskeletal protein RodZ
MSGKEEDNGFWNNQSPEKKAAILLTVGFVMFIVIMGIIGSMVTPTVTISTNVTNNNTTNTNSNVSISPNSSSDVNTSSKVNSNSNSDSDVNVYDTYDYWYGFGRGDGAAGLDPDKQIPSKWDSAYMAGWEDGNSQYLQIQNAFNNP